MAQTDSTQAEVQRIIEIEAAGVAAIPLDNPYGAVTELIYSQCCDKGGKLVITGVGKAGEIATKIATTFCSTGTSAVFLHPLEAVHGDLGILQRHDVLFAVSNSGRTREILELLPHCRRLIPAMPVIGLTANPDSELGQAADLVLRTGAPKEACPLNLTPTTSTTVMSVIGDILVSLQLQRLNYSSTDYALRHHGGYLGAKARSDSKADAP